MTARCCNSLTIGGAMHPFAKRFSSTIQLTFTGFQLTSPNRLLRANDGFGEAVCGGMAQCKRLLRTVSVDVWNFSRADALAQLKTAVGSVPEA